MPQTAAVSYPISPDWYHMFSHLTKIFINVEDCKSYSFTILDSLLKAHYPPFIRIT